MSCELRLGHWSRTLRGRFADVLISDPPYSARTHAGHAAGTATANEAAETWKRPSDGVEVPVRQRRELAYPHWSARHVHRFVRSWSPRVSGWFVCITDHVLAPVFEKALESQGRYVFPPLGFVNVGGTVRMRGDGPASWTRWIITARPRNEEFVSWGALPGGYCGPSDRTETGGNGGVVVGAKPLWLMRALVRDYSRPGNLVVDPCAGGGTTLLASRIESRRALGSEIDAKVFAEARARLRTHYTPDLLAMAAA